ncbi:creatininase family protein [Natrialbaceae archaeon A-chndr2]
MPEAGLSVERIDWAARTYPEITELGGVDGSVLVVPVGSVEQHGPHMPVATDIILAEAIARGGAKKAAERDVPVLLLPPVWSGTSQHHLHWGGTLTVEVATMLTVLEEVAASALQNDFDAILFLNGHGGNAPVVNAAVKTVGTAHPDVEVLATTYYYLAEPIAEELRESEYGGMSHAGEFETSLMLHIEPALVREEEYAVDYREEPKGGYDRAFHDFFSHGPLSVYRAEDAREGPGTTGDPTLASSSKGEAIYEFLVDELAALLGEISESNAAKNRS